jgi:hypothetical protein
MPAPRIRRPFESRSAVTVCRASTHGRRRGTGVIIVPILMRSVAAAIAPSATHGSHIGEASSPPPLFWM